jgi:23S rRNA maturation mini-RNase III
MSNKRQYEYLELERRALEEKEREEKKRSRNSKNRSLKKCKPTASHRKNCIIEGN